jgi:hypothetical protein
MRILRTSLSGFEEARPLLPGHGLDFCVRSAAVTTPARRFFRPTWSPGLLLALPHDQAGVAWSHYQLPKEALEAAVVLGAAACAFIAEVEQAPARALSALGTRLYRWQRSTAGAAVTTVEWRRVWQAYHARKLALAA